MLRINNTQMATAIEQLRQLVAIPSISNPNNVDYSAEQLHYAADLVFSWLKDLNFEVRCLSIEGSAPYLIAQRIHHIDDPTILLYAHYDVQPVERDKWDSSPFELSERNGRLYGRGASDDKAGIIAIIAALAVYKEAGITPSVNIKILIEGEEEYGSINMEALVRQEAQFLDAQALIVIDGNSRDIHTGTLESSTRGVLTMTLQVHALQKPVHSGIGCLVPDPAQALASLIHSLSDPRAIPGFMDDCEKMNSKEKEMLDNSSQTAESYAQELGMLSEAMLRGDPRMSVYQRIVEEPSISILNITCGKSGGGNSIQDSASCTIGVRLTPGQDPEAIAEVIQKHIHSQPVRYGLSIELNRIGLCAKAWKAELTKYFSTKYLEAMKECFEKVAVKPTGATLPLLQDFKSFFPNMEMLVVGIEDPDTAAHSHNESQDKKLLESTINALIVFLEKLSS